MAFSVAGPWLSKAGPAGTHGLGCLLVMPALQGRQGKLAEMFSMEGGGHIF